VYEETANGGSLEEPLDNKVTYVIGIDPATLPGSHVVIAGATYSLTKTISLTSLTKTISLTTVSP
jgi:hypothetical protein